MIYNKIRPLTFFLKIQSMQYLNKEIEALTKRKKSNSLVKNEISCGIFQDVEKLPKKEEETNS
ncbi:hypothetical protein CJ263_19375 [Maribacter cobaltidurans]|uniref:Uncharacterized protein n=1 Tax=Maribacter cobaltidurans TaxID=1178778 RepID=A0A223VA05_9FLAO|nr:hypothetical protein CJ263_19375 [Maribacter cobaltidurans]